MENIIERCLTLATSDVIEQEDLPEFITLKKEKPEHLSLSAVSVKAEKEHIIRALKGTKGSKTRAAELLGISRKTLWEKMNAYKINL
jgi:transcriptional regulator with PAS, ATPase and Fis domain